MPSNLNTTTVRPLLASDKPQWLTLFKAYIAFYKSTVADEVIEATWTRLLADEAQFHRCLVTVDAQDRPIGLAHFLFHRSTWSATWYCYLEDLYVQADLRAAGAGEALINAVYAAAEAQGTTRVYWSTEETNYRARGLYDKLATKTPFIQYRR